MTDLLIRDIDVVDGTGAPRYRADVLVDNGRITEISSPRTVSGADKTIDPGPGYVLTPGFIDMHAHSDLRLLTDPGHFPKISQGVTTEVIGQDGISYTPIDDAALRPSARKLYLKATADAGWETFRPRTLPCAVLLPAKSYGPQGTSKTGGPRPAPERSVMSGTQPSTEAHVPTGTLEHLDPNALLIGENVRDNAALDAQFLASVREHGVLQPITAVRTEDGVAVRDGQRRTLAARQAGLAAIPVYVLSTAGAALDAKTADAERIAQQIVTNDQRTALTDAQRAKGINQMLLAGISAGKVARILRTKASRSSQMNSASVVSARRLL